MPPQKFLVTGATGGQGGATARQLLALGHQVNALVRDSNKPSARGLGQIGAAVFGGDYDDSESLEAASQGCSGVFLVTMPGQDEAKHAENVLAAAKKSGVGAVVCSTVTRAEDYESFGNLGAQLGYWTGKAAVQEKVESSGLDWTILQPAWLMTNLVAPSSRSYWPELASEGVLLSAMAPDTILDLTDSDDVGRFAAQALVEAGSSKWNHQVIRLASEAMTMGQIAAVVQDVAGKKVEAKFHGDEFVAQNLQTNPFVWSQNWQRRDGTKVDFEKVKQFGVSTTSLEEFLLKHKARLDEALS